MGGGWSRRGGSWRHGDRSGAGPGCGACVTALCEGQVGARDPSPGWGPGARPGPASGRWAAGLMVGIRGLEGAHSEVRAAWDGTPLLSASSALLSHLARRRRAANPDTSTKGWSGGVDGGLFWTEREGGPRRVDRRTVRPVLGTSAEGLGSVGGAARPPAPDFSWPGTARPQLGGVDGTGSGEVEKRGRMSPQPPAPIGSREPPQGRGSLQKTLRGHR